MAKIQQKSADQRPRFTIHLHYIQAQSVSKSLHWNDDDGEK
jgi:hypothetical protein